VWRRCTLYLYPESKLLEPRASSQCGLLGKQWAEPDSLSSRSTLLNLDIPTSGISSILPALTEVCWTPDSIKGLEWKEHPCWNYQNITAPLRPPSLVRAAYNSKQYHQVLEDYLVLCLKSIPCQYKYKVLLWQSSQQHPVMDVGMVSHWHSWLAKNISLWTTTIKLSNHKRV
jgi:hypothetical protein